MITIGSRVQLHPACDEWMQGDRYGTVVRTYWSIDNPGKLTAFKVKLDRSGRVRKFHPENVLPIK